MEKKGLHMAPNRFSEYLVNELIERLYNYQFNQYVFSMCSNSLLVTLSQKMWHVYYSLSVIQKTFVEYCTDEEVVS